MTTLAPRPVRRVGDLWRVQAPPTKPGQDRITVALGLWLVAGVFIDGWAHASGSGVETFFTPWHAILYSGATAVFGWFAWLAWKRQGVPLGYRAGLVAAPLFVAGGGLDFAWHAVFGIEENINALLSPTHLLLFMSGVLVLSTPWRASSTRSQRDLLPWGATLSLYLTAMLVSFFLVYASPFSYPFAALGFRALPEGAPGHEESQLPAIAGLGAYLVTTLLLVVPLLLLLRRGNPPRGAATVLLLMLTLGASVVSEFEQPYVTLAGVITGVVVDGLLILLRDRPDARALAAAVAVPAVVWPAQLLLLELSDKVRWPAELTSGVVVLSAATAAGAAWVMSPRLTVADRG